MKFDPSDVAPYFLPNPPFLAFRLALPSNLINQHSLITYSLVESTKWRIKKSKKATLFRGNGERDDQRER